MTRTAAHPRVRGRVAGPGTALALAGLGLAAAGCSAPSPRGFEVLSARPASGELRPSDLYPPLAGSTRWRVTAGDGAGSEFLRTRERSDLYGASWCDQEGARRSEYWRLDESGNLVMDAIVEHDDNAVSTFTPALVIAPAVIRPGEPWRQEVSMTVTDARRPSRQRDAGTATRSVRYIEDVVLRTSGGKVEASRLLVEFEADLRMARAQSAATLYVVRGVGPVVEEHRDSVRLLKVPIRSNEQVLVLVPPPAPAAR